MDGGKPGVDAEHDLEILREGFALLPRVAKDGIAVAVPSRRRPGEWRFQCSCGSGGGVRFCPHMRDLERRLTAELARHGGLSFAQRLDASGWWRLAEILAAAEAEPFDRVEVTATAGDDRVRFLTRGGVELLRLGPPGPRLQRFLERIGHAGGAAPRFRALGLLAEAAASDDARALNAFGFATRGQRVELSLWGRFALHAFRELGEPSSLTPSVDDATGGVMLGFRGPEGDVVELMLPRTAVQGVIREAADLLAVDPLTTTPVPLRIWFAARASGAGRAELVPNIESLDPARPFAAAGADRERFRYGDLVYLGQDLPFGVLQGGAASLLPREIDLASGSLPGELARLEELHGVGAIVADASVPELAIVRRFDELEVRHAEREKDGWWVDLSYRVGAAAVPLQRLLAAQRRGEAYLRTEAGIVDLNSAALAALPRGGGDRERGTGKSYRVRMSPVEIVRLRAAAAAPLTVSGKSAAAQALARLEAGTPSRLYQHPVGLHGELRPYQQVGVGWLRYLFECGLSGLLCDEMGLGKTHQVMAFVAGLRAEDVTEPVLIVCPTTVMSHWQRKLAAHAPGLRPVLHHGAARDVTRTLAAGDVVLTSYGVLRLDVEALAGVPWSLVVFDEAQNLKSARSQANQAARALPGRMKLAVTGTPLENEVADLKTLFDVVLPGYFGSDQRFELRYGSGDGGVRADRRAELQRLTAPFILRRLKSQVLRDLPAKIEDTRTCVLSEEQAFLYRQAVARNAPDLVSALRSRGVKVPYLHVFALIDRLKQICDHPALIESGAERYKEHASGKWELFTELLAESLDSGQKVVVFTQYLGMLAMMAAHLSELGVGHATLSGATRDRGEVLARFERDETCRVFLGSLKAGGTGIDLIAGSIVIHYDRWWNPAREDQATDRVHRIGQTEVVQVFKLVTEGTLEEKIDAIIARKRKLFAEVVRADDPELHSSFTREELLELIATV